MFDKTQATAVINSIVINDQPLKVDQQKLSEALDELFAKQAVKVLVDDIEVDKTVQGIDYHVYGGVEDHTSDLDERVISICLLSGYVDQQGTFHEDFGHPSIRVPVLE